MESEDIGLGEAYNNLRKNVYKKITKEEYILYNYGYNKGIISGLLYGFLVLVIFLILLQLMVAL